MSFSIASSFLGVPARVVWTEISGGNRPQTLTTMNCHRNT